MLNLLNAFFIKCTIVPHIGLHKLPLQFESACFHGGAIGGDTALSLMGGFRSLKAWPFRGLWATGPFLSLLFSSQKSKTVFPATHSHLDALLSRGSKRQVNVTAENSNTIAINDPSLSGMDDLRYLLCRWEADGFNLTSIAMLQYPDKRQFRGEGVYSILQFQITVHCCGEVKAGASHGAMSLYPRDFFLTGGNEEMKSDRHTEELGTGDLGLWGRNHSHPKT